MFKIFLLQIITAATIASQTLTPMGKWGNFNSAVSISINNTGFVFVADEGNNEIFKYDTLGNVIKTIGGYGWGENQFDSPSDVFAGTLKIYVADKNNNRILLYDKDLNYISELKSEDVRDENYSFGYPTACGVSNQGFLFILDSDNSRILKLDLDGNFLQEIGGTDAGGFALTEPSSFAVSPCGNLFAAEANKVFVFDQYGNGLYKFTVTKEISNVNFSQGFLIIIFDREVKIYSVEKFPEFIAEIRPTNINKDLKDAFIFNKKLYLLTSSEIFLYPFVKK